MVGYMHARQLQANRQIARDLIHEYRAAGYTEETLYHELCVKTSQDEVYKSWGK
jgi:glutamine synthetase